EQMRSAQTLPLPGPPPPHGLDGAPSHTATATVTIPATTPPNSYFLLACADDQGRVAESNESNNCLAAAGTVTVARPDLAETAVTANPPAPVRAPGTTFAVTDT